jgi:methionyl-tRNA synthetase
MYSPKKPEILNDSELEKFKSICNECSRGPHCNWCHFTYTEVECLLLTIDDLKKEIVTLKNVQKSH